MPPIKSGYKSSELHLTAIVAIGGFIFAAASMFLTVANDSGVPLPPWVRAVGVAVGLGMVLFKALGYTNSRSALKLEQMRSVLSPIAPQLVGVVQSLAALVADIKGGGLFAPGGGGGDPALSVAGQAISGAAALFLPKTASPLADELTKAAEGLAGVAGDAAAKAVVSDKQAADVLRQR